MTWQTKTLGEVCEVVGGGTPSTSVSSYWEGEIVWITPKDLGALKDEKILNSSKKLSKEGLRNSSAKLLPIGAVVLSSRAPIGHVALAGVELATNQGCRNFVCSSDIYNKYLYYFLKLNTKLLNDLGSGSTFKEISGSKLKTIPIRYPGISEQKRIVAILDEAFAAIEKAKENAEKNLQNAKELFEAYLQSVFEGQKDWQVKTLGECLRLKSGDFLSRKQMKRGGEYSVFGGNGIAGKHDEFNISGNNIIIGRVGALCGRARNINEKAWLTDNAFKVINYEYGFDNSFLVYLLNFKNLRKFARQAAQPVISNSSLKNIILSFPESLSEQKRIVTDLNKISDLTNASQDLYTQKFIALNELKQSLLHKAFHGEL